MGYNPRYQRPFVGTTITIQDDAITPDKLDDKAVEEKHLADNAVSKRAVGTAAVGTDELKDGDVKTADIGDAQVTEPKLADGAVTEDKLSFTPAARPLTPGVATVEIADDAVDKDKVGPEAVETPGIKDGAVTEAKLAGDAVVEVKIKDRAVTGTKIALDTIDHDNIKADSVRGPEIQAGAVSHTELSADAVRTAKILDNNVTLAKLEPDIHRLLLQPRQFIYDDFIGATLRPEWASSGDPGGSISRANSNLKIRTSGLDDEIFRANFGGDAFTSQGESPRVFIRALSEITFVHIRFGLFANVNNYILFDFDTDVDGNWHVKTKKAGAETDTDTGIAATALMKEFLFLVNSPAAVVFFIDGAGVATHNADIPTTSLQPLLEIQNRSAATRLLTVDKYILDGDKSVGLPPP